MDSAYNCRHTCLTLDTGVVKIHAQFDKNDKNDKKWPAGTGYLIRPDLVVTAGHVVLQGPPEARKRAICLRIYVGYQGLDSVEKPDVQKRTADRVLVLKAYYDNQSSRHDVAFVKLGEPFENIQPFTYSDTPEQGTDCHIGVVGYPGDKDGNDVRGRAPFMYEEFADTTWNLSQSDSNLLSYSISTYGGK